jgi:hypothetical protein
MKHMDFARIAEEEAAVASRADGVDYFLRTAPADGGTRASITIHMLHPESGESIPLFRTPDDHEEKPILVDLTEADARGLVQETLSIARAIYKVEMDPDWRRYP